MKHNDNFFLYNFGLHERRAWTEKLEINLRSVFVVFMIRDSDNKVYNPATVWLDGTEMEITSSFLKYYSCFGLKSDMKPLLNQLNGNLIYKGQKFSVMDTDRANGHLFLRPEKQEAVYMGCIKPNGINMLLRADFTCKNEVWQISDFERMEKQ